MKHTVRKDILDELIRLTRKYQETGDADFLPAKHNSAFALSRATFGNEYHWLPMSDLCQAVVGTSGLAINATNEDIYGLFKLIGYDVEDPTVTQAENRSMTEPKEAKERRQSPAGQYRVSAT